VCDHLFVVDCFYCGDDGVYSWITCSEYKDGKCCFGCTLCGEIVNLLKEKDKVNESV
jgi:hypothetical protein